jgi:hypothetical protein
VLSASSAPLRFIPDFVSIASHASIAPAARVGIVHATAYR